MRPCCLASPDQVRTSRAEDGPSCSRVLVDCLTLLNMGAGRQARGSGLRAVMDPRLRFLSQNSASLSIRSLNYQTQFRFGVCIDTITVPSQITPREYLETALTFVPGEGRAVAAKNQVLLFLLRT